MQQKRSPASSNTCKTVFQVNIFLTSNMKIHTPCFYLFKMCDHLFLSGSTHKTSSKCEFK